MNTTHTLRKRLVSTAVAIGITSGVLSLPVAADIKPLNTIRVNQHGYLPNQPKMAVFVGAAGTAWQLKDASGATVTSGVTTPFGADQASGDTVSHIDFSGVTAVGDNYYLEIAGAQSYAFKISDFTYTYMKEDAAMYFYHQRLGEKVDAQYVGAEFAREAGHLMDDNLLCDDDLPSDWDSSSVCSYALDVRGGHADAGDYGAYVVNGGYYTWMLQYVFESNPLAYADGSLYIPENNNAIPDILDEARYELDFILRMQVPQDKSPYPGMIHHKKSWQDWGPFPLVPADDDGIYWGKPQSKRTIKPVSTAATLNGAAVMAQAARLWQLYPQAEGFDGSSTPYHETLVERAEIAWSAALNNPVLLASSDASKGSGPYDDDTVSDEFYWAAVELFITTGKPEYKSFLLSSPHFAEYTPFDWKDVSNAGHYSLLLNKDAIDLNTSDTTLLSDNLLTSSSGLLNNIDSEGYLTPLKPANKSPIGGSCSGSQTYPWGSIGSFTLAAAHQLGFAHRISGDSKYLDGMTTTMDHVMGVNALDRAYMTGYGENPTKEPHHRFWLKSKATPVTAVAEAVAIPYPGAIAGGPQNDLVEDGTSGPETDGTPCDTPAKSFADHWNNYSSNEITVNWNANLVAVLAYIEEAIPAPSDTLPPSTPTDITAIATSGSSVEVSWTPAFDNGQVKKYEIHMNPAGTGYELYASTMFEKASFVPLTPGQEYCFRVVAVDYTGQKSSASSEVCETTPAATSFEIYYQPDNSALSNYVGTGATNQPEDPATILGNGWYHYVFHQTPPYSFHFAMPNWGSPDRFSPDGGTSHWNLSESDFNADQIIWLTADKTFHTSAPALVPIGESCEPDCPNVAPSAASQTVSIEVDEITTIALQGSDTDGTIVSYDIALFPTHGTVSVSGNVATYVPDAANTLADEFGFTVTDNEGAVSNVATVSINVVVPCTTACPPVADAKSETTDMNVATVVTLTGSDDNGTVVSFQLDSLPVNGAAVLVDDTVTYTPGADFTGEDSFTYVAIDDDNVSSTPATVTIQVNDPNENQPPVACFESTVNKQTLTASFNSNCSTDDTTTNLLSNWTFGDSHSDMGTTTTHTYAAANKFTVTLTVTDKEGLTDSVSQEIDLIQSVGSLTCEIGSIDTWPGGVVINNVVVTNTGSEVAQDWEARISTTGPVTVTNSWNANLTSTEDAIIASGDLLHPGQTATFGFQGSYSGEVSFGECTTNGEAPTNRAPVADFSIEANNLVINLDASTSSDADGDALTYQWSIDGVADAGELVSYSFTTTGTYTVVLTVNDGLLSDALSKTITVSDGTTNTPPLADFSVSIDGLSVAVDGSTSLDADMDPLTYVWNFGGTHTDTGVLANHTFTSAGQYTISLAVDDGRGGSNTIEQLVTVTSDSGNSSCSFEVVDDWESGFNGKIVITNNSDQIMNDWQVSWAFTDGSQITNTWNAVVTLGSPNTATPLSWNATIAPGATAEFGLSGNKGTAGTTVGAPIFSGDSCQ